MFKYNVLFALITLFVSYTFAGPNCGHDHSHDHATVKNELYFMVPADFYSDMGIETTVTKKNEKGTFSIPNDAIFTYEKKPAIFLLVDTHKFAVRTITVDSKGETHSTVSTNMKKGEKLVTGGVKALEKGLARKVSNAKGHSHGAGGHTH